MIRNDGWFSPSEFQRGWEKQMEHNNCMNEQTGKHCHKIEGIRCNVENCYYHDAQTNCTAHEISVGPGCAHCSDDTICATFKPRENG